MTESSSILLQFHPRGRREVVAEFNGATITSDAWVLLFPEVSERLAMIQNFARCIDDFLNSDWISHPLEQLLTQRIFSIARGYEDLNDPWRQSFGNSAGAGQGRAAIAFRLRPAGESWPISRPS